MPSYMSSVILEDLRPAISSHVCILLPEGLNDPYQVSWSIYHTGTTIGTAVWPPFSGLFGRLLEMAEAWLVPATPQCAFNYEGPRGLAAQKL